MARLKLILSGSWPTLMGMALFFLVAILFAETWPSSLWEPPPLPPYKHPIGWLSFVTYFLTIGFLSIKATILLQRMGRPVDWVTISLALANLMFALIYTYSMTRLLYPSLFHENTAFDNYAALSMFIHLIGILIWGVWKLTTIPPPQIFNNEEQEKNTPTS